MVQKNRFLWCFKKKKDLHFQKQTHAGSIFWSFSLTLFGGCSVPVLFPLFPFSLYFSSFRSGQFYLRMYLSQNNPVIYSNWPLFIIIQLSCFSMSQTFFFFSFLFLFFLFFCLCISGCESEWKQEEDIWVCWVPDDIHRTQPVHHGWSFSRSQTYGSVHAQ